MKLDSNEVHIWLRNLKDSIPEEWDLLNDEEKEKANCYRFPIHKKRFVTARAMLRVCLSHYLNCPPDSILFSYDEYGKPYLQYPHSTLQFNVSHSDDFAVYAFIKDVEIGIDIEKIDKDDHLQVAKRFFSELEIKYLKEVNPAEKAATFYRIWTRKEAIIKAIGKGFALGLKNFSVPLVANVSKTLVENKVWYVFPITIHPDFECAFATQQIVQHIKYWQFHEGSVLRQLDKI